MLGGSTTLPYDSAEILPGKTGFVLQLSFMAYGISQDARYLKWTLSRENNFLKITPKQGPGKAYTTPYIKIEKAEGKQIISAGGY